MTQTEKLLTNAADIAKRRFLDPSESAVMEIFRRLCDEADALGYQNEASHHEKTIH